MSKIIVEADLLITMDEKNTVLRNGAVAVHDGEIVAVGVASDVKNGRADWETLPGAGRLLMPGLINSHTHLAMALLRGWSEGVDLQGFLERVWDAEGRIMNPEVVRIGTALGAYEAVRGGTTTTLDMYFHPHAAHQGAVDVGLRHVCGPIFFDFPGLDGMEWAQRIDYAKSWAKTLSSIGGPEVPFYLMPHSTYTVSPENLKQVAQLAREQQANIHIHASENQAENADVASRYEATPTKVISDAGMLQTHVVLGHGVWLSEDDYALLAAAGGAVAHCPGSNLKLASGAADFYRMRSHVSTGLGTDGCSSSNDLDMWVVMRTAALLATSVQGSPAQVHAIDFVRAATIEAARAIGIDEHVGSLAVGKRADFIRLDLEQPHLTPIHDVFALLVFAAGRADVVDTFIDGVAVMRDRVLLTTDASKILEDARNAVAVLS